MLRMDDDSVERFFRKADDSRFKAEYNENDWKKMEQMLDQEGDRSAVVKNRRRTYSRVGGALLVMLIFSLYFFIGDNQSDVIPHLASDLDNVESSSQLKESDRTTNSETEHSAQSTLPSQNNNQSETELNTSSGKQETTENNNEKSEGSLSDSKVKSKKIFEEQATASPSNKVRTYNIGVETANRKSDVNNPDHGDGVTNSDQSLGNNNNIVVADKNENSLNDSIALRADSNSTATMTDEIADSVAIQDSMEVKGSVEEVESSGDQPEKQKSTQGNGRWMITLAVAPDFSKTTKSGYDSPGDAFGVFVQYQFMNRWSVSTGFMRSDKKYWGYGDEYKPPYGYWYYVTNGVVPETVDGNCLVWEVPLSLAFNVVETKRSRLFATAGISSYFMRSENYEYTFDEENPGAATGWSTDEPSSYWFGIGSLSVGYDYRVSPTLSFGVEPYYKIPFAGVGWANIDLYSMGVLFNARYRFLK